MKTKYGYLLLALLLMAAFFFGCTRPPAKQEAYYNVCTSLPKTDVEDTALDVRRWLLNGDMERIADMCSYPIKIHGTSYRDAKDLLAADIVFSDGFLREIEAESCHDMYATYQGVAFGRGVVWLSEILDANGVSDGLKIIAFNDTHIN